MSDVQPVSSADRCQPRDRPRHRQALRRRGLARADDFPPAFDPRCPWPGGERNHIQLDLADVDAVRDALPRIKEITGGRLDALINNAAVSPKHPDGSKITSLEMAYQDWLHIFNVNFFSPSAGPGFERSADPSQGQHRQHDVDRRFPRASVCQRRLRDIQGGPGGADAGDGERSRPLRRAGECRLAG